MGIWALYPDKVPIKRLKELAATLRFQVPLNEYLRISLDFGEKFKLCPGGVHAGVDYSLVGFEPVLYATTAGWIEKQGFLHDGTGFITERIDTGYRDEEMWAIYYHVREKLLPSLSRVEAGTAIGKMTFGAEGSLSTGHHLHVQFNYGQKGWQYTFNPHQFGLPGSGAKSKDRGGGLFVPRPLWRNKSLWRKK